ncbi:MAG: zinc-binding protein [Francisellaceae bacterium]|nr:zinc-binding protein [Francisellaceae bacterium]
MLSDEYWMQEALKLAEYAQLKGEVPVGAILTYQDNIIASGWNQPIQSHDPSAHAEIITIRKAGQQLQNYRLLDTTLYVTLEPCVMCLGAIMQARIKRLVFGAFDVKRGALGGTVNLCHQLPLPFNHKLIYSSGVLETDCKALIQDFFKLKRHTQKNNKD